MTGRPAATVPAGFTKDGLPDRIADSRPALGRRRRTAAAAYEAAAPWKDKRQPMLAQMGLWRARRMPMVATPRAMVAAIGTGDSFSKRTRLRARSAYSTGSIWTGDHTILGKI